MLENSKESSVISLGTWLQLSSPEIAAMLASCSFDWLAVDLEHGTIFESDLPALFHAIASAGKKSYVRLKEPQVIHVRRAADLGADGIIIPMVESIDQAQALLQAAIYPPEGQRGVGFSRSNQYGRFIDDALRNVDKPDVILQIETATGLANLDGILEATRPTAAMIGPYDLSASLGIPGRFDDETFRKALQQFLDICNAQNIAPGMHVVQGDPATLKEAINDGFRFIAYGIDTVFLRKGLEASEAFGDLKLN